MYLMYSSKWFQEQTQPGPVVTRQKDRIPSTFTGRSRSAGPFPSPLPPTGRGPAPAAPCARGRARPSGPRSPWTARAWCSRDHRTAGARAPLLARPGPSPAADPALPGPPPLGPLGACAAAAAAQGGQGGPAAPLPHGPGPGARVAAKAARSGAARGCWRRVVHVRRLAPVTVLCGRRCGEEQRGGTRC